MIDDGQVVHEATYPYPPERVWHALVEPAELAAWLMPNNFVAVAGGRFTMTCEPLGQIDAEVLELDPPRRLSCRWHGSFGDTIVTFDLAPTDRGTRLRVVHQGWDESNTASRDGFDSGWTAKLGTGLGQVLAGTPAAVP